MKYTHPEIETVFDTENGFYNSLVIENQDFMRRLLTDLYDQIHGDDGQAVISRKDAPVSASRYAELIDSFVPFEINRKTLVNRVSSALEREAVESHNYEKTAELLSRIENYLNEISFSFLCDIEFTTVAIPNIIRACTPKLRIDASSLAEQVLDYMELVSEFDAQKLFFTLNMRAFVSDRDMEFFAQSALDHGYHIIAIENTEHPKLTREKRVIIDSDLCEIA